MATVNVYRQFFAADCCANGVGRRGALVLLIADSTAGQIRYEAAVSFFPHRDEEDYAVSYDAYASVVLYDAPGRRSKKREKVILDALPGRVDALAASVGGVIRWDQPLRPAQLG